MERNVVRLGSFFAQQVSAKVFLVVVAKHGDDSGVGREFLLGLKSREEIAPRT
jgi:hypothetical protein